MNWFLRAICEKRKLFYRWCVFYYVLFYRRSKVFLRKNSRLLQNFYSLFASTEWNYITIKAPLLLLFGGLLLFDSEIKTHTQFSCPVSIYNIFLQYSDNTTGWLIDGCSRNIRPFCVFTNKIEHKHIYMIHHTHTHTQYTQTLRLRTRISFFLFFFLFIKSIFFFTFYFAADSRPVFLSHHHFQRLNLRNLHQHTLASGRGEFLFWKFVSETRKTRMRYKFDSIADSGVLKRFRETKNFISGNKGNNKRISSCCRSYCLFLMEPGDFTQFWNVIFLGVFFTWIKFKTSVCTFSSFSLLWTW